MQTLEGHADRGQSCAISTDNQLEALSVTDRWVTVHRKRMIRLPPDRQAWEFVIHGSTLAVGSPSGIATILNLDFKQMDPYIISHPSLGYARTGSPSDVYDNDSASVNDNIAYSDTEMEEDEEEDDYHHHNHHHHSDSEDDAFHPLIGRTTSRRDI